jgi:glycosyltransferase involved in cell wall biosynthesis
MVVKSVTMISWELDPYRTLGGTAYAIRRLANQLTELGVETRVLLPDCANNGPGENDPHLLKPMFLKMPAEIDRASRGTQCSEFGRAALEKVDQIRTNGGLDAVIAHSLEGAMSIVLRSAKRSPEPSVFWLHSLYDPRISDLQVEERNFLPQRTLLASAVTMADVVVTSAGILQDAREFEWPEELKELQKALIAASTQRRVLTVESIGCLPKIAPDSQNEMVQSSTLEKLKAVPSPYVLFPGRPSVDKGLGFFAAIAERLRGDKITCVAVQRPSHAASKTPRPDAPIYWLPWLTQAELVVAMRNAACAVLPSITEGFGLAAAESICLGLPTLYQQVGGHHGLKGLPNALPISITTDERAILYRLWAELFGSNDYWSVWTRHESLLNRVIDRWVEAIRMVVSRGNGKPEGIESPLSSERLAEEQWGNKLRRRFEGFGTSLKDISPDHVVQT